MIILDLDGVLANFSEAASLVHGHGTKTPSCWDWYKQEWGITTDEFWQVIHGMGDDFYKHWVTPYPWAVDLLALVAEADDFIILSSPSDSQYGYSGKKIWVDKYLQPHLDQPIKLIVGSEKHLMAGPDRLLIDDYDKNTKAFARAGGHTITFPQPWNRAEQKPGDLMYVASYLHYWHSRKVFNERR